MPEKAPYKLTVKLDSPKPEHVAAALTELRERAAEYDQTGEATATVTFEFWQEAPMRAIMDAFETWLFYHGHVDCEMKPVRPGVRPETRELLSREKRQTPMDAIEGFAEKYGAGVAFVVGDDEPISSDARPY